MRNIFREIVCLAEFKRELKRLTRKHRTLEDDLSNFIETQLNLFHKLKQDNGGIKEIPNLGEIVTKIFKAKKFACKALKGSGVNSGIRVIYAYFENLDKIELIEIYHKNEKGNEDRERILRYYKKDN